MTTVEILGLIFAVVLGTWLLGSGMVDLVKGMRLSSREDDIRSKGRKASALVKKIEPGGGALGSDLYPPVRLRVIVENERGEFYPAQIETTISVTHMPQFQPGARIEVAYDPADPTKVVVLSPTR